jgi:hypothetical protein
MMYVLYRGTARPHVVANYSAMLTDATTALGVAASTCLNTVISASSIAQEQEEKEEEKEEEEEEEESSNTRRASDTPPSEDLSYTIAPLLSLAPGVVEVVTLVNSESYPRTLLTPIPIAFLPASEAAICVSTTGNVPVAAEATPVFPPPVPARENYTLWVEITLPGLGVTSIELAVGNACDISCPVPAAQGMYVHIYMRVCVLLGFAHACVYLYIYVCEGCEIEL